MSNPEESRDTPTSQIIRVERDGTRQILTLQLAPQPAQELSLGAPTPAEPGPGDAVPDGLITMGH